MLPISGASAPTSPSELEAALSAGFLSYGVQPKSIMAAGSELAHLQALEVDLSGATLTRDTALEKPATSGSPAGIANEFKLIGEPILLEGIPASIRLTANQIAFDFSKKSEDRGFLIPRSVQNGALEVRIPRESLEALLQKAASEAASKQGVEIKETHIEFTAKGERSLSFRADVVGKIFVMKAPVSLTGEVTIDEEMNLHLSNLAVGGSGMLANLANSFAQPHLKRAQAQPISLGMFRFSELRLRDIRLEGAADLRLRASFA